MIINNKHKTGVCRALAQYDYTIVTTKNLLSYVDCQEDHQCCIMNMNHSPCYDRYIITDRTVHNNRPHTLIFDIPIKQAYLIDSATRNSHILHRTLTEKLHKSTDLKEDLIRIRQLTTAYSTVHPQLVLFPTNYTKALKCFIFALLYTF